MIEARAGAFAGTVFVWATSTGYTSGNLVIRVNSLYLCISNHTSGTFYTDWLTNGYWVSIGDSPGKIIECGRSTAESGYLLCDGKTVGDATSGADYAGDTYRELYEYLQNTFGGTYNWSNHDVINLPDKRGVFTQGAGTTDRVAGVDANGNPYTATIGTYGQDQVQDFWRVVRRNSDNSSTAVAVTPGTAIGSGTIIGSTGATAKEAITNGVNGTPRVGTITQPMRIVTSFMIKY